MKISNDGSPPADSDASSRDVNSGQKQQNDEPSPFSKILAKRQGPTQDNAELSGGKRRGSDLEGMLIGDVPEQPTFDRCLQLSEVEAKHVVQLPPDLQQLVREISVVAGGSAVNIELNLNVLKGLHIRIEKQNEAVAIQFQSTSEDVARLLSRNLDSLSQGLADRGVNVADIRVTTVQDAAGTLSYKSGSKSGSGSGSGFSRQSQSSRQGRR
jgi:Flagellar hook-length control protein FliK